jgi:hypothetical protein
MNPSTPLQPVRTDQNWPGPAFGAQQQKRFTRVCGGGLHLPSKHNRRYTTGDFDRVRELARQGHSQAQISTLTGFPEGSIHYLTHGMPIRPLKRQATT